MNTDIQKYIQKSWKKENGKVFIIGEHHFGWQLVIEKSRANKKTGKKARYIHFLFYDTSEVKPKALVFKKHDRVKCRFVIHSKEGNGKWHTHLELKDIQAWKVNEKKQANDEKIKQRESDNDYKKGFFGKQNKLENESI